MASGPPPSACCGRPALVLVLLAAPCSGALARPSTVEMSCAQARTLVHRQGAIVLRTGGPTYERFVRDRSFCEPTETGRRAFVPTRDGPQCPVGYTCDEPSADDRFGGF